MDKYAIFELSMPNVGSWNGSWSGSASKYVKARTLSKDSKLKEGYHYYNFGDGWGAGVSVEIVEGVKAKNSAIKNSKGFCSYDWMIDSIIKNGKIISE